MMTSAIMIFVTITVFKFQNFSILKVFVFESLQDIGWMMKLICLDLAYEYKRFECGEIGDDQKEDATIKIFNDWTLVFATNIDQSCIHSFMSTLEYPLNMGFFCMYNVSCS